MGVETAPPRMTVEEYLIWAEDQDGRHELENGRIVAMAPERTLHLVVKGNVYQALRHAIERSELSAVALPDGASVRIGPQTIFEPDALVYAGAHLPDDTIEVPAPLIVVEVLSPTTARRDATTKLAGYFAVPSIAHYLIVDPEERLLIHHARRGGGAIETRISRTGSIDLDPPGLTIAVADVFPAKHGP